MKFSVFVAGGRDRWDPREDRPSAKCHAMMMTNQVFGGVAAIFGFIDHVAIS